MKKNMKILFPTDFSNTAFNALRNAILFTDQYEASFTIQLMHVVIPESDPTDFPTIGTGTMTRRMEVAKTAMTTFTETVLAQLQVDHQLKKVPDIQSTVEIGLPVNTIARIVKRDDIDLILMGMQGEHSTLEKFFGSVTTGVIRKATCPVLVIPENFHFKNIVTLAYATNLADTDPYHIWKMSKFLHPFHPIIRVVHIATKPNNSYQQSMENLADFFEDNVPGLQITFHNKPGKNVIDELINFTDTMEVDLLVMPHPHRSFLDRLTHTSVTKNTALRTSVPILFFNKLP